MTLEPLERIAEPWARPRWRTASAITSYAALGDSFTAGTGCEPGECFADRLATRLAAGCPGFEYRNFGVEGATSEQVLDQLAPALRFGPDLATVVCGANDVLFSVRPDAEAYARRLTAIFKVLRESAPKARILTATAPERFDFLELGPRTRARLERGIVAFNAATREVAATLAVPCLEVADHPGLAEPGNFVADGLHPSADGHDQAATGFARLLGLDPRGDR
ncbi:MAG: SGNH/GDSL hydrolase family protein [Vicinamibacteria bacterium]|jgi:lysophospholipase L1-like esterase